jgi:integrase
MAKKRRGNSEGSIYRTKDGRWRAAIHVGWHHDGKRLRKVLSGKTRAEVAAKLAEELRNQQLGLPIGPERQTVSQYLSHWLDHVASTQVRPKTLRTYSDLIHQHLIPALGRIPLLKLTPQRVREFMTEKLAEQIGNGTATYSPRSVAHMRDMLRAALSVAVRDGVLPRNSAALVAAPRGHTPQEQHVLGPEEARRFLSAVSGSRLEALFSVALALGLREGECLGLRWQDVDLECGTLTVRYQLQRDPKTHKLALVEPKTGKSRRTIALPAIAAVALRAHQMRQEQERLLAADRWQETGMVFTTTIGTMLDARNMLREFYRIIRNPDNQLNQIRFHDLRHSAATLLLTQGVHPRVVMEILGHSSINLTMNTYSHVIPALEREAANQIDAVLNPAATSTATNAPMPRAN